MSAANSTSGGTASRLPGLTLNCYAALAFPLAAAFIALQVIVPTFYAETTGLSLTTIGLVLLVARLWDTFTDPVVGILSDRTPAFLGRRKIWIVASTPLILLAVWQLFVPPQDATWQYLMLWTVIIYVAGTMAIVPLNAWGAELSPVYNERNRIAGARAAYGLTGTLVALLVAAVAGSGTTELSEPLRWVAILVAITLVATVVVAYLKVPDDAAVELPDNTLGEGLKLLKTAGPLRQLLTSFLVNSVGNAIPATLFLLYVTYVLEAPQAAGKLLFAYFICAALSIPLWTRLAKRYGKHQTWSVGMLVTCALFTLVPLLSADTFWIFSIIVVLTGVTAGADLILPVSIKGDLIEWDAHTNGLRRPGLFFALWGTTTKLAFGLAIGIAFPILELAGFSASSATETLGAGAEGTAALALIYSIPAIVLKLIAVYLMRNYPITQKEHERMTQQVA